MIGLALDRAVSAPIRVLAIGAHPDDIEIGCGGTLMSLAEQGVVSEASVVVLSGKPDRAAEAELSANALLEGIAVTKVILGDFVDGFFPYDGPEIKRFFEELKADLSPDLIFTHQRRDLHQDHRLSCELTWNTFRDHMILEYEIPKYDGDMGPPNLFVPLGADLCRRKIDSSDDPLPIAATEALVQGGPVLRSASSARHGVQLANLVCRRRSIAARRCCHDRHPCLAGPYSGRLRSQYWTRGA